MVFSPYSYFSQSFCIYFLFLLPVAILGLPFYYVTKRLPGIIIGETNPIHNAIGAVLFSFIPIVLFELPKYSAQPFQRIEFILADVIGIIIYLVGFIYLTPLVLSKINSRISRILRYSIKVVSYASLFLSVVFFVSVFVVPEMKKAPYNPDAPNLLIISIDALRRDHLPKYGYDGIETPHIDRFLDSATSYNNAYCSSPWTLPSFGSLFTGFEPTVCGLNYYHPINRDIVTLPELLKGKGYRTECYYTNWIMYPEYGLSRGFDLYMINPEPRVMQKLRDTRLYRIWHIVVSGIARKTELIPSDTEFNRIYTIKALEKRSDQPFFIWCHFFDPHSPYLPPDAYIPDTENCSREDAMNLRDRFVAGEAPDIYSEKYRDELIALYDGEIAYVDEQVGLILRALDDSGLSDNTVVVIINDHGEEFWEHGEWGHGFTVFPEQADMVLAIRNPFSSNQPGAINTPVSHTDVAATLSEMLDVEWPYEIQGESSIGSISGLTFYDDSVFTECYGENEIKGIRKDGYLYYRDYESGDCGLYNLRSDPEALIDISEIETELAEEMAGKLDGIVEKNEALKQRFGSDGELKLTPDREAQFKALGYLD